LLIAVERCQLWAELASLGSTGRAVFSAQQCSQNNFRVPAHQPHQPQGASPRFPHRAVAELERVSEAG